MQMVVRGSFSIGWQGNNTCDTVVYAACMD